MKESTEWISSWCDHTEKADMPRILLIGDSITRGYQGFVRELLRDACYVDYIATSYAIDTSFYFGLIRAFVADSDYAAVHLNHGLHGVHMSREVYEERLRELLCDIRGTGAGTMLATTTIAYEAGNQMLSEVWTPRVEERNAAVSALAKEFDLPIDDLYSVSLTVGKTDRSSDGIHYTETGFRILAESVAKNIKNNLLK